MPETFYVGEQRFDIPDELSDKFLSQKPDAVKGLNYVMDDKSYSIPPTLQEQFTQQNPNAILQEAPLVKEEQPLVESNIQYTDSSLADINNRVLDRVNRAIGEPYFGGEPQSSEITQQPPELETTAQDVLDEKYYPPLPKRETVRPPATMRAMTEEEIAQQDEKGVLLKTKEALFGEETQEAKTAKAMNQLFIDDLVRKHGREGAKEFIMEGIGAPNPWGDVFVSAASGGESRNMLEQLMTPVSKMSAEITGFLTGVAITQTAVGVKGGSTALNIVDKVLKNPKSSTLLMAQKMGGAGATLAAKTTLDVMGAIASNKDISVGDATKQILVNGGFGMAVGAIGSIPSPYVRIPTETAFGYVSSKMMGGSEKEAIITALTFAGLGMLNNKNLKLAEKEFAYQRMKGEFFKYAERNYGKNAKGKVEKIWNKNEGVFRKKAEDVTIQDIDNTISGLKNDMEIIFRASEEGLVPVKKAPPKAQKPPIKPVEPAEPKPIEVKPEKPVEPVKPTEIVKEPKIEPVEVPKEPATPVEVTPVSPVIGEPIADYKTAITKGKNTIDESLEYQFKLWKNELASGKVTEDIVREYAKNDYEDSQNQLKEFEKDPLAYLEKDLKEWRVYEKSKGKKFPANTEPIEAMIAEFKKEAPVEVSPEVKPETVEKYTKAELEEKGEHGIKFKNTLYVKYNEGKDFTLLKDQHSNTKSLQSSPKLTKGYKGKAVNENFFPTEGTGEEVNMLINPASEANPNSTYTLRKIQIKDLAAYKEGLLKEEALAEDDYDGYNTYTIKSIQQVYKKHNLEGIPPVIVSKPSGWKYDLIDGQHRLVALNELGVDEVFAYVEDIIPEKPTSAGVKKEQIESLNKQYTDLLNAQAAAQSNLMLEGLAGMQKQQMEQSFEQSTKRLEDLELEAKTNGITLEKKITETEAIKEVVDLFKELDPEVDYQTKLDELRTLQDNIDDPLSPETPENALAQIEAAGQELAGVEPSDLAIAGENYQELRDGALVDVVKLHKGADIGTVIEERAEIWYRRQEKLNPKFDKKITELRDDYYEQTGEKDDPSQSNGEWFSDRAKDNAIGAKPKGKFGDALTRLFKKFREYADALRKSASRFAKYVKEGKVSKELKSFLDRSVSEKLRTSGEIKTIKEGTAVKTGVPNYELILKKKARTHSELKKLIPESQRVVVKKGKNEPYPHVSGSKFKDLPALEKTESNVTVTQSDINKAYNDALESAGIDQAGLPADMEPMGVDFWNDALSLPDQVRYWYEISAEAFGERFVDMTPAEIQTALAVSSAASVQATPDLQIARTISILAQVKQGKPVTVGTPVPKTVQDALFESLKGLKTGNFEQTFSYILGYVPEAPLSTNDRQVAAYFNISPDLLGSEGNLYEALSKFHINLRDIINKKLPEGVQPYESWQLQALPWVQMRRNKGVSLESNDLQQALDNTLVKLENAGIDVPRNPAGDMIITNELLNNPKVIDVLSPTSKQFEQAKIATVEVASDKNPEGKEASDKLKKLDNIGSSIDNPTNIKKIDKLKEKYYSIHRSHLGLLSKKNKNLNDKSIIDELLTTLLGRNVKLTRIEYGRGTLGTFEGVANPNMRIPMTGSFGKNWQKLTETTYDKDGKNVEHYGQIDQFNAMLGGNLDQAAMAASVFEPSEPSKNPDTHSVLIKEKDLITEGDLGDIESTLNSISGKDFSFSTSVKPNGTLININPHFNEDFSTTSPEKTNVIDAIQTVLGDKVNINIFDNAYDSSYIGSENYGLAQKETRNDITKQQIKGLQDKIGGTLKEIRRVITGKKEIGNILEGYTKSDISRAEKARLRYRTDNGNLDRIAEESTRVKDSLRNALKPWNKEASVLLDKLSKPNYQLKKITPDERKLREEKKRKLAELMDEGVEAVKEQIPEVIKNRRAELSLTSFETNSFLNEIKQITTPEQRELIPFLLEKTTNIPKKLNRPDLEKLMQDKKLVENLQPVVESFRHRYKELWKRLAKENAQLSNKEIKDYVTHIWDVPANKKSDVARWFSTYNKFTEKRYIETLTEGIDKYDLKPKYTDINDIYNIYASIANNSLANKKFVADVRKLNVGGKPFITTPQHAPDGWSEIHHPAMKNPFTQTYYKVHPDIVDPLKVVLSERKDGGKIRSAYESINGVLKQAQLSLSLFHHLALSETAMPIVPYKNVPKMLGVVLKTPWKGFIKMESDVFKNQEIAKDFLYHLGQLGVSADIPVQKIASSLKSLEVKFKGTPLAGQAAKLATGFYERWNFALWDYLHDHFKLYAYESLVADYKGSNIETFKYEAAAMVNDTFGGQNWDVLMVNPKTVQTMTNFLLSPDWLVSTTKQALAPTGIGSATKTKEGRKMRRKLGAKFLLKAFLYYSALINTLNTLNRKKDMEDNPDYYPDKDDYGFWDYTMFGNTIGSQTRLFMGRYADGTERYLRWGKQFRELPELFYDETGFNFPQAALKKLGSKAAPLIQTISQIFTGRSPSGFENYDLKDKKGIEWIYGVTKTLMKTPLPFSTQAALDKTKEWKFSNLAVPSSRGMTAGKAGDLMEIALTANDEEMMRQIFIGCSRNKINGLGILEGTMSRMKRDYRIEETRMLRKADQLEAKANDSKTRPVDKAYLMKQAAMMRTNSELAQKPQALYKIGLAKLQEGKILYPDVFGELTKDEINTLKKK